MIITLASASPRRRDLLRQLGLPFRVARIPWRETFPALPPDDAARWLAWRKAEAARRRIRRGLIITGDTLVALGPRLLGKPRSPAAARAMLWRLSGRTHRVITALVVMEARTGIAVLGSETSHVTFRRLPAATIAAYVATGETRDKAGAYAIQGKGRALVARFRGDYTNIVGLPLTLLTTLLNRSGVRTGRATA